MIKKIILLFILILSTTSVYSNYVYRQYGNIGQIAIPVLAGGVSIYKKDWAGVLQLAESAAFTMAIVHSVKNIINAKRPHGGQHSFPSGHTAGAFIGASYLHKRYGFVQSIPAYIAAALVGHSRIVANAHWFRDVLGASLIAIGINYLIVKPYKNLEMHLGPTAQNNGLALNAKYSIG